MCMRVRMGNILQPAHWSQLCIICYNLTNTFSVTLGGGIGRFYISNYLTKYIYDQKV